MNENTIVILYVVTFLIVGLLFIAPIVLIVWLIAHVSKKSNQRNKELQEQIMARHMEKERLAQEELNLKKMQYKRVRCLYCDSLNPVGELACSGCGASLKGAEEVTEKK